ncbi:MAG: SIS domain-containing protein [Eubacteriales bacterium]
METIQELTARCPALMGCAAEIEKAAGLIIGCYQAGHTLYTCGNGGSAADADHIVGELMKGFLKKRPVSAALRAELAKRYPEQADFMADNLQCGLPAISLHSQSALLTAFANDVDASMMYAQAIFALGRPGDVLLAISTSGNSKNVVNAARTAKAMDLTVLSLTGEGKCALDDLADCAIHVGAVETYRVQELHLPVYHWLCARVESIFYKE